MTKQIMQITNKQTLVLTIEELYRVIPNTRKLEGYNFKDLKELLVKLIGQIEEGGNWEFVQYINNKPSFFVVREITTKEVMYTHQDNPYEDTKEGLPKKAKRDINLDSLEPVHEEKIPEPTRADMMTPPSITFTKLPWES